MSRSVRPDADVKNAVSELQARRQSLNQTLNRVENLLKRLRPGDFNVLREIITAHHNGVSGIAHDKSLSDSGSIGRPEHEAAKGSLDAVVRKTARSIKRDITAPGVVEYLSNHGFQFRAKRPVAAVGVVLVRMVEDKELVETEPGAGRRAARYAVAQVRAKRNA